MSAALLPCAVLAQATFDCAAPSAPVLDNPVVLGNGAAGSVTTGTLQNALDAGGDIRLNVGTSTIALTQELVVSVSTTLDAGGATLSGGNAHRVLHVSNPNNLTYTFNLLNATISGGNSRNAGTTVTDQSGAGLWKPSVNEAWQAVTIRIFNSHFAGNTAVQSAQDDGGGGAYVTGAAEFSVIDSVFDNDDGSNGGAAYSLGSKTVNFFDSTFSNNTATGSGGNPGNGGNGGAIGVDGDARNVNFCRVRILGNSSNAYGGGFFTTTYSAASFTRILDSTFDSNASVATNKLAGGAYIQGSPITIQGSTFSNNQAAGYTGLALFGQGGVLTGDITNSTFAGNTAKTGLGGGLSIQAATSLTLQNLTIANNSAPCTGCFAAGISNDSSPLTLRNVIFSNNTGGNIFNPWAMQTPATTGSNNLQWPLSRGSGQSEIAAAPGTTFADALLLPLAANGGYTQTMALPANSPAVNAGTSTGALPTDQRGVSRFGNVDIGAYEFAPDEIFANGFD
ncbi:MAG: choice-of-anchor Q domain-containing protein [Rudaea sp.]|nr:choice-of-anchor Q domain-containing protein [Rudaea sp.]